MTKTTCHISISLDGFVAGPDQDRDNPAGVGGLRLHEWHWHAGEPGHEEDGLVWVRVSAFSRASRIRACGRLKRLARRTPPTFATASGAERAAPGEPAAAGARASGSRRF